MLSSKKDILECSPPFVMEYPAGDWSLVTKISGVNNILKHTIVYIKNGALKQRYLDVKEPPFYVGAEVWELDYGSVLMTLNHPSLLEHPARKIWEEWLVIKNTDNSNEVI